MADSDSGASSYLLGLSRPGIHDDDHSGAGEPTGAFAIGPLCLISAALASRRVGVCGPPVATDSEKRSPRPVSLALTGCAVGERERQS